MLNICNNASIYVLSNNLINLFIVHLIGDRLVGMVTNILLQLCI